MITLYLVNIISRTGCLIFIYRPQSMAGKHGHMDTWMEILNPPTSAKPVMTKLQNLLVALVNMDIFQMSLKLSLFTVDF